MTEQRTFPSFLHGIRVTNGVTNVTVVATERSRERVLWLMNHLGESGNLAVAARENDPVRCQAKYMGMERRRTAGESLFVILFEVDTSSAPIQELASLVNEQVVVSFTPTPKPQPQFGDATVVGTLDLRRSGIGPQQEMTAKARTGEFAISDAEAEAMGMRKAKSKGEDV